MYSDKGAIAFICISFSFLFIRWGKQGTDGALLQLPDTMNKSLVPRFFVAIKQSSYSGTGKKYSGPNETFKKRLKNL